MPLTFSQAPFFTAKDIGGWRRFFSKGLTETILMGSLGDSQETETGSGRAFVAAINYEMAAAFRNCPATPIHRIDGFNTDWMITGASAGGQTAASTDYTSAQLPPGLPPRKLTNNGSYPPIITLHPDNKYATAATGLSGMQFWPRNNTNAELVCLTRPGTGTLGYTVQVNDGTSESNYFAPTLVVFGAIPGASVLNAATGTVRVLTWPMVWDANPAAYPSASTQFTLTANGATAEVLGIRFRRTDNPAGVVVDSLGSGGYTAGGPGPNSYLANHSQMGPILAQLGYKVFLVGVGTNDIYNGRSLADFKADLLALMAYIRQHIPDARFIFTSDPVQTNVPARDSLFDQVPGVFHEIASDDAGSLALNTRRQLEMLGYTKATPGVNGFNTYSSDGVHQTPAGGRLYARCVAQLLIEAVGLGQPPAVSDVWASGVWAGGVFR